MVKNGGLHYLGAWPDQNGLVRLLGDLAHQATVPTVTMPEGVRRRQTASHEFIFNHNANAVEFQGEAIAAADLRWKTRV